MVPGAAYAHRVAATDRPPLTARSVLASTLLGSEPPALPVSFLVRAGALFGFSEGAVRTALSRMVAAGELEATGNGWYQLAGPLVQRQHRQRVSRAARDREWDGAWVMAVVTAGARTPAQRVELRTAMTRRRFAELREGAWTRPANLDRDDEPVDAQCYWFLAEPEAEPTELAAALWDLPGWAVGAQQLQQEMAQLIDALRDGDPAVLAPGFVLSAAVLRHFLNDPLLPDALLPADWPGPALRAEYDLYDAEFRRVLTSWVHSGTGPSAPTVEA